MGLLNLFKREVPEVGFEFEDLERMFGNLRLISQLSSSLGFLLSQHLSIKKTVRVSLLIGTIC